MDYIIIDFEWNGSYSTLTKGYFNELIEIGAVRMNEKLNVTDTFRAFIHPVHHKRLTSRVKKLTNITNDQVRAGRGFCEVYSEFSDWVGENDNCFISWGTGDMLVLLENLEYYGLTHTLSMIKHFCDAQEICQTVLNADKSHQLGLSAVAEQLGISCEGKDMHRALDDSMVTAECLRRLWDDAVFEKLCSPADEKFYRKLTFKTAIICDINNPLIDHGVFELDCPQCGERLERTGDFYVQSRCINAPYRCERCEHDYIGRHHFKLKFEGLIHRAVLKDKPAPKEEQTEENQPEE